MAKKVEAFFIVPSVLANQNIKYVAIYVDLTNPSGTSAASFAQKIVAILDTGANISVIDAELINTGRLQKVGENAAVAAGVRRVVERYRCQIIIKE